MVNKIGGNKENDGFAERTVAAMAAEIVEARNALSTVCVQFVALAKALGVPVALED